MQNSDVIVCRLCLKIITYGNYATENIDRNILDFLIPEVNLEISLEPKMCNKCHEILLKCYQLKLSCDKNPYLTKLEFALEENTEDDIFEDELWHEQGNHEEKTKCCICMKTTDGFNVKVENSLLEMVLGKCLPNVNNRNPEVACTLCSETLQQYSQFIDSCLQTEKIVKNHYSQFANGEQFVDLYEINKSALLDSEHPADAVVKLEVGSDECNALLGIKIEAEFTFDDRNTELKYKEDSDSLCVENSKEDEQSKIEILITCQQISEGILEYRCEYCSYQTCKKAFLPHLNKHKKEQNAIIRCASCQYQARDTYAFLCNHLPIHEVSAEMLKCSICPYETTLMRYLVRHMSAKHASGSPTFKCDRCSFVTKHRTALLNHLLIHKDESQVPTYQCKKCTYTTKHKRYLHRHMLIHKSKSEVRTYICDICAYKANRKDVLRGHLLKHRSSQEKKTYSCSSCDFETVYKQNLKIHRRIHKATVDGKT